MVNDEGSNGDNMSTPKEMQVVQFQRQKVFCVVDDSINTLGFVTQLAESLPHLEEGPEPGWPWEECRPFPNAWA